MFLLNLTAAMPKDEVETHIISFYDGPLSGNFKDANAKIHIIGDIRKIRTFLSLYGVLKDLKPDIVNNHMNIMAGYVGLCCKKLRIPFVMYSHSTRRYDYKSSAVYKYLTNLSINIAKQVKSYGVGVSKDACRTMWGDDYNEKNVKFVNLGIDFSRYMPQSDLNKKENVYRKRFDIPNDAVVIANVAGYRPQKKYNYFIAVAAEVLKKVPNTYFLMIGEGTERESMEKQISELGISDHCRLTGFLDDVPEILKTIVDVFLFTSGFEGLGLALVEAQAAGIYCVYSNVVPKEAIINNKITYPMSLNDSPDKWSNVIRDAINDKRIKISKNDAYQIAIKSDFNIIKTVNTYVELWKSLIKQE